MNRSWEWDREPVTAEREDDTSVTWRCHPGSDYWRLTEGLPPRHDGSALLTRVEGDFELTLHVSGTFTDLYDQVGLLLVASEPRWLKAGIEVDGELWLSAVHTREESDWSKERWHEPAAGLRATRHDGTVMVSVAEGDAWRVFRVFHLPGPLGVGPYSCSPKGDGFVAVATGIALSE